MLTQIEIPQSFLEDFCARWRIQELSLFGSVVREDFGPDSDIDVLVRFEEDAPWDMFHIIDMQEELSSCLGRPVDLVEEGAVQNPFRKRHILASKVNIFAAT